MIQFAHYSLLVLGITATLGLACATVAEPSPEATPTAGTPSATPGGGPDEAVEPQLNKLDALLTGVVAKTGDSQKAGSGVNGIGEYEATQPELDSFPFYTDDSGRVYVNVLIKTNGSVEGLDELEVIVQNQIGSIVTARAPLDSLSRLTNLPNVEFIQSATRKSIP